GVRGAAARPGPPGPRPPPDSPCAAGARGRRGQPVPRSRAAGTAPGSGARARIPWRDRREVPEAYLESGAATAPQRDRRARHHVLGCVAWKLASQPELHEGRGTTMLDSHARPGSPGAAREALESPEPV